MSSEIQGLVSTVIPVFNRPKLLEEAVASVLEQTYRPIEIIIADDGSDDDTRRLADELAVGHGDTVHVLHLPHRGAGPAREAGRLRARGEFIQYLDSDDRLLPRKFELQVAALRTAPHCGAAYGYIQTYGATGSDRAPLKWSGHEIPQLFPKLLVDRWWNTDCPLFRRSVCDEVGPWSDLRYSQDWEYDARVGALRTELVHVKDFVCEYRQHAGARQTGTGRWLDPPDRVRFFTSLLACARQAGVTPGSVEMRHFSRWVFHHARECGAASGARASRALLRLATEAAGRHIPRDLEVYRMIMTVLGARNAARLTSWLIGRTGRRPGRDTLPLSSGPGVMSDA